MKILAILVLAIAPAAAQDSAADPCLVGLKPSLQVLVEDIDPGTSNLGIGVEMIRTDATLRLREAGFGILGSANLLQAVLDIEITTTNDSRAAFVLIEVAEPVTFERVQPTKLLATTWRTGTTLSSPTGAGIRQTVKDCIDRFLNDWLAANPVRVGATGATANFATHHE